MLASLRIKNLALVEELAWQPGPGFVAITGETGSGKSIILGALHLLLGERADRSLIRTRAESCAVEAVFTLKETAELDRALEDQGLEPCVGGELILKRTFTTTGTNRQFVNCSPTTLAVLKSIGDGLVDLHGPHDHQSLLSADTQLDLLDAFAGSGALRRDVEKAHRQLNTFTAEQAALSADAATLERELDLLRHQSAEIESAHLDPAEEETTSARYTLAANSRRLIELSQAVLQRLTEAEDAALPRLAETQRLLRELERLDPAAAPFGEAHARAVVELGDLARTLQNYAERLDLDPAQLAQLEERVTLLETLKRKYGGDIPAVIEHGQRAAERLRKIESRGEEHARLDREIAAARKTLATTAAALSKKRAAAAPKLAKEVRAQLRDLGFKKSEFSIDLPGLVSPASRGSETAEFLFAPNPGEPAKPLKSIASSGEISRVMLAVKSALAAEDTVPVLVFDEIDANVGGEIAHAVGARMAALGREHQVLCITHLPQVAAQAASQFVVSKDYLADRTISQLTAATGDARIAELARMLGGQSASALAHARTLLAK